MPLPVLLGMAALGLLLIAAFWVTGGRFEGFGLSGVIVFYLALGFIIVRGREKESGRRRTGLLLLGVELVAGVAGVALLGHLSGWPSLLSVILLAVGVLVLRRRSHSSPRRPSRSWRGCPMPRRFQDACRPFDASAPAPVRPSCWSSLSQLAGSPALRL